MPVDYYSGIDGLVVQLGDVQQLAPIMARANSRVIPVVTTAIGSHVPNTITDVGGDNPLLAILATESLLAAVGYAGDIYVVWVPGAPLLETRKRILEAVCADHPGIRIHEVPAEHNPAKVQAQIEDILTANPTKGSITGIFGTYDDLVSGASEAIRRASRDEIKLVVVDGDRVAFQMLFQDGSPFVATVVQDSISIGRIAGETIIGVLNGTINPDSVPPMSMAQGYVASRKNGVAAAEKYWGLGI
jgi:ABC-type sugar transport system substrate-binding protein